MSVEKGAMKVCISNKESSWLKKKTGKARFIMRLIPELIKLGVEVTTDHDHDVDLDLQLTKYSYKPRGKSIIRYGPTHLGHHYKKGNQLLKSALDAADGVIYQSNFGKKMCDSFLGPAKKKSTVIYNGANPEDYGGSEVVRARSFVLSTRTWTPQKRLKQILKSFLLADIQHAEIVVMGTCDKPVKHPSIKYFGQCDDSKIEATLAASETLISLVWLDCMPNSVCEALCAGMKVITTSTSGTAEIAPDLVLKEAPWDFKPTNNDRPPKINRNALAELMIKSVDAHAPRPEIVERVNIKNIAKQYYAFFQEVLNG